MRELHRALGDIRSIRQQMASGTEFRGYGPVALAATGLLGAVGGLVQAIVVPQPTAHPGAYLAVWVGVALVSLLIAGVTMWTRSLRLHSGLSDAMMTMAVQQFVPALLAGSLMTPVLLRGVAGALWMLPGLWMVLFSLGMFASCRFLPRMIAAAGGWYLLAGLMTLGLGDARALSPWTMGFVFGAGQMLVAGVLQTAEYEAAKAEEGL